MPYPFKMAPLARALSDVVPELFWHVLTQSRDLLRITSKLICSTPLLGGD